MLGCQFDELIHVDVRCVQKSVTHSTRNGISFERKDSFPAGVCIHAVLQEKNAVILFASLFAGFEAGATEDEM